MRYLQTIKTMTLASVVPVYLAALGYHVVQDINLKQERNKALLAQNPAAVRQMKHYTLYGFDDNNDGSIDRIVQNGTFAPGPRPGVPGLLYREYISGDREFGRMEKLMVLEE